MAALQAWAAESGAWPEVEIGSSDRSGRFARSWFRVLAAVDGPGRRRTFVALEPVSAPELRQHGRSWSEEEMAMEGAAPYVALLIGIALTIVTLLQLIAAAA